ncbi:hypothetical protein HanRHA438_Chr08g0371211 [Helianthus annuus]|uniref:Transposase (putative) gypsy type domain-containing protein n=1 Tax=Helianthus annuus TaxID=4232 RepID=A0A9K3IHU1_HELAN|nr:hypothetical protein HanXRQr2_Chr08g0359141 [Helianthus annuus]KAJ0548795.1 hypothetical protein HanIR_Chr08g0387811 [Helianthus annuus]KAJ0899668.1 hypothetical protein HanRHA438_Chr08g0371211 [Helianthus annuus]KAJ0903239.1 hypothetical protein HanPSC8_Chr08g0346751 [Helianthus annuus]
MLPLGITMYATFFREGNFRLPMAKFTGEVLSNYGLHISQINALGLPRITHLEFICRANRIEPTFEMFTVFYIVSYIGGFYSFNSRTSGISPCIANPPKSLHDWKQKFFYIRRGVIPIDMHYRDESEGIPRVNVSMDFVDQEWYKVLTRKATSISQVEERALVRAGMSMLWVPKNPRGIPVYGYQGKVGYSLLNVLDPKAVGPWLKRYCLRGGLSDWIRSGTVSCTLPAIVIVLSSEGSDRSREGLIPHSPRAGRAQGAVNEPVNEPVVDVNVPTDAAEQLETRKKKEMDKFEEKKKVEEPVSVALRKQLSNFSFLDYVVVSDTLSGLDAGDKRTERDPDDDETLTEIMKKKRFLKTRRKSLMNKLLLRLPLKSINFKRRPPLHLQSRRLTWGFVQNAVTFWRRYTPLLVLKGGAGGIGGDAGGAGGDAGGAGGDGRGEGVDTEAESSEATPRQTIYTKVVRGSGQGGTSGTHHSPEYEHVQGGSWDTHNPACADLPHAPDGS